MSLLLISFSTSLRATEYVVNDVKHFKEALLKLHAGDVIVWENGNYTDIKIDFTPADSGTLLKPIYLKAQEAGKVVFSGSSNIRIGGTYLVVDGFTFTGSCTFQDEEHVIDFSSSNGLWSAHCRLTNCAIINYSLTEESGITNYYVNLVGAYNEVDHCYFSGKTNKGPTLVVEYKMGKGYVPGSDKAPSSYHHIHHNYFGYRTFSSNGGEQMRIGTSTSSFTHGFNVIEFNYIEDERIEAEIISNKSWDNIYRYNTFMANDGGMVIRHGQRCFVYGNYINGRSGRNQSAGLRIINSDNTVFNNYLEDLEGGEKSLRSPISIMSGLEGSALNEYYPADNAIIAYNTVVNSVGPVVCVGAGNASKGKPFIAPQNVRVVGNTIITTTGKRTDPVVIENKLSTYTFRDNLYTNGSTMEDGFKKINMDQVKKNGPIYFVDHITDKHIIDMINERLAIHHIKLKESEILRFDPGWIMSKKDVGVSWKMDLYK